MTEKPLIKSVQITTNPQGYPMAYMACHSKRLYVAGHGISYGNGKAQVLIATHSNGFLAEWVEIPFTADPDECYTVIAWDDKSDISVLVVPIEFVCPKE